ncbi:ABC transporter substrate-binding protein [Jiulongibacter sediminis]|jgi:ABC-type branched-subunit amino acid transport system substrate-binding protein|uniref:ABC transporter substrate-binding protein n=1 Tax=Jiulongibacter sediminis TaxID=1605367 RepID=UPI0026F15280|nr:ABC transporter substrate-binding protein [Jiulongibacter sediminis]
MRFTYVLAFLVSFSAIGQLTDEDYLLRYKEGVQAYASGNSDRAIDLFTPLTSRTYNNAVSPYALYYFALASIDQNKSYQARATLRDLFARFETWEKIDDAYYLYGYANFVDNYFGEGLSYLERITSSGLSEDVQKLKQKYIPGMENVTLLKELNEQFPADRLIAETLVKNIQKRSYNTRSDLELSDLLTNRFNLKTNEKKNAAAEKDFVRAYDDEVTDIGLLLPFDLNDFKVSEAASTKRYVFDLYTGMKMAEKELNDENIRVRVSGFDVDRTAESAENYLKDPDFKKVDILVGPLYGRPNRVIESFAEKNKIYQVHPISNNSALIADSDARFLLQPSNKTIAEASLDFVESLERPKTISIFHDGSRNDSLMANVYEATAKARGFTVEQSGRFTDVENIKEIEDLGHVFIAGNSGFGTTMMRALAQKNINNVILSTASSFNLETISRSNLRRELYLVYPEFADAQSPNLKEFKKAYIAKMKALPSYYTYLGYDFVKFYGRMMKDGKEIFRLNMDESPQMDDLLLSGFDYSNKSSENKSVPIVKYNHGLFEIVNQ